MSQSARSERHATPIRPRADDVGTTWSPGHVRPPRAVGESRWRASGGSALRALLLAAPTLWLAARLTSPYVQPADSGELQLVARDLGIAHPPGYPLYTVAAHVFAVIARLPWRLRGIWPDEGAPGGWAWAINLFSTVLATLTLVLAFASARRLTRSRLGGALAAAALLATPTFVAQALVANVRIPAALLAALLLHLGIAAGDRDADRGMAVGDRTTAPSQGGNDRTRTTDRLVVALALVVGLAVGHHPSLVAVALPVAAVVVARRRSAWREPRTLGAISAALVAACLPVLYLPWRDAVAAPLAPGTLTTVRGLLEHVTAFGFRGDAFYLARWTDLVDRLLVLWNILEIQFGRTGLLLAAVGAVALWRRRRTDAAMLLAVVGAVCGLAITYRAPQTTEYLLPAYVAVSLFVGAGAVAAVEVVGRRAGARALVVVVVVSAGARPWRTVLGVGQARLPTPIVSIAGAGCLPAGTTVLASWHHVTPLWFALADRADSALDIVYVHPEGAERYDATWDRHLAALDGPVVVTNRTRRMIDDGVPLWPVPGDVPLSGGRPVALYATRPALCRLGEAAVPIDVSFGGRVRLDAVWRSDRAVTIALHALTPVTETLTLVAQAVDPATGTVWGQVDHAVPPGRWNDPRGVVDRLSIVPYRAFAGGWLDTTLGVYRSAAEGPVRLTPDAPPVTGTTGAPASGGVAPTTPPRAPRSSPDTEPVPAPVVLTEGGVRLGAVSEGALGESWGVRFGLATPPGSVPFADAMTLDRASARRDAATLVVDLLWRAGMHAADSDYTVSVQVHGHGWDAQHDGTPALGAIPTLKWLPGMVVRDRHRVTLPADLPPRAAMTVTVGVYDAFSLEPLPVTDADRVRRGEGQAAVVAALP